jgi:hypothetical protein
MHNGRSRRHAGWRAGILLAHAALVAACGYHSVQIPIHCEDDPEPPCVCGQQAQAPVCVHNAWACPTCMTPTHDAGADDARPDAAAPPDATTAPPDAMTPSNDASGAADAGDGGGRDDCGDGSALVCRAGCGERVREWRPTCYGTTWRCRWNGSLEERSTPPRPCDSDR